MPKKRTKSICLRLSPEEHQMVAEKAKAAGLSASALLRDHLGHAQIYNHRETQRWFATLLSVRKLLAAIAERAVVFRPADAAVAIAYLASMSRHLEHLQQTDYQHVSKILPPWNGNK